MCHLFVLPYCVRALCVCAQVCMCAHASAHTRRSQRRTSLSSSLAFCFIPETGSLTEPLTVSARLAAGRQALRICFLFLHPRVLVLGLQAQEALPLEKRRCWGFELRPSCLQSRSPYPMRHCLSSCLMFLNTDMLISRLINKTSKGREGERLVRWYQDKRDKRQTWYSVVQ